MLNLATLLEISARRDPGKVAVIFDDMKLRYAEVNGAANKIANGLVGMGVRPGDKVALMLPNTPHFVICYYAILKLGATVVPMNVLFKRHEVGYHLDDSDAVALIVWEGFLGEAAEGFAQAKNCRNLIVAPAYSRAFITHVCPKEWNNGSTARPTSSELVCRIFSEPI